ncbi:uncharacterized protein LOC131425935 [Malaya genurostris]|uniref:uncharacterized protein LOC131425935 n=1 Tax=Malaya genurostris TaxID=325434 RepID=UPI0026F38E9C|nr:uncharacterized protein LOC131425935 [Malaya genurostris]
MLNSAGFPLKKWASNSCEVLAEIPEEDRAMKPVFDLQEDQSVSTLGLVWEPKTDILRFKVQLPLPATVLTKRNVMSYIAQIFDPLGLVGPTVMKAKLFMQRLWSLKSSDNKRYDWDQPLPTRLQEEWRQFHSTISLLRQIQVPRFISLKDASIFELHLFSDASEKAYGACCYIRAVSTREISVQLLASKCKVTPLSTRHSIARLELCAARLSTQLYKKVSASLKISPTGTYFWTDSTTVLQWLSSSPSRWKTFVANRVSQIQQIAPVSNWKHIAGVDNPADDISRGLNPPEIINRLRWWHGTSWLSLPPNEWPEGALPIDESSETTIESKGVPLVTMSITQSNFSELLFGRFSNYTKLRRTTAYCLRYLQKLRVYANHRQSNLENHVHPTLKRTSVDSNHTLNTEELLAADVTLCRLAQQEDFPDEYTDLKAGKNVSKSSAMKWLQPYIDVNGVMRVGGRLRNAACSESTKHPIILRGKHPLSLLLASYYHRLLLHAGPLLMLATLRQRFWILGGRNLVRQTYHKCHTCFRSKPILIQQSIADLPSSRVTPTRPFSICGIDYCGPFYIKSAIRNRGPTKAYVAIFICFSTRAIHIELVSDLSTAAFLAALRRLVARRGKVIELHSDNATAFKGASHQLNRVYRMLKVEESNRSQIFNWCANNEIRWKFIPPRAPHFGGLWEAAVKSAKSHLLKEMGNTTITYEDFLTLLAQVEMCLNSRPLTPLPSDSSDLEVLTPGHFLVGSNLQAIPEPSVKDANENHLSHWDQTQRHLQRIWDRWYPEYLQQLQSRATKGCNPPVSIEPGKIVIIKEDNVPPAQWPLGKILSVHPGDDGIVRVVTIRTATASNVVRPVAKLAFLPMPCDPAHSSTEIQNQ